MTFLHVYHHAIMVICCYFYVRFVTGGGQPISLGIINSFVHVIMYGYYFFTSYKPQLKNSLCFKRHITELQMIQFMIFFSPFDDACFYGRWLWLPLGHFDRLRISKYFHVYPIYYLACIREQRVCCNMFCDNKVVFNFPCIN